MGDYAYDVIRTTPEKDAPSGVKLPRMNYISGTLGCKCNATTLDLLSAYLRGDRWENNKSSEIIFLQHPSMKNF